jgi:hypothetical protein
LQTYVAHIFGLMHVNPQTLIENICIFEHFERNARIGPIIFELYWIERTCKKVGFPNFSGIVLLRSLYIVIELPSHNSTNDEFFSKEGGIWPKGLLSSKARKGFEVDLAIQEKVS